jgi:iron complex outermembrane receptor protein
MPMKHSMQIEIVIMATIFLVALGGAAGLAQEAPPRPAMSQGVTEEGLRDRLQQNVREREELLRELEDITRRRDEVLPVEEKPQRYQEIAGPQAESTNAPDAIPVYDLADISIVSKRVQKLPEGLAFSATPRSETDS